MSTLFFAAEVTALAETLARHVEETRRGGNPFVPTTIVVPNPQMSNWLKLELARRHAVAININFSFIETALWQMLRQVDPREHASVPEMLDGDLYRLLTLSVLLQSDDADLDVFRTYLESADGDLSRRGGRRAWKLAEQLSVLIRDYEYHRQQAFMQPWVRNQPAFSQASGPLLQQERAQRAIFQHIIREPDGMRALLNHGTGRNYKTLPQYAMEVREVLQTEAPKGPANIVALLKNRSVHHLFGLGQISALHFDTLHWLSAFYDLRLYLYNPLAPRLPEAPTAQSIETLASAFRDVDGLADSVAGGPLVRSFARAGAESLWLAGRLLHAAQPIGNLEVAPFAGVQVNKEASLPRGTKKKEKAPARESVLDRLQRQLLGQPAPVERLPQDGSLQIIACPGMRREVETAYHGVLSHLQHDKSLRQTDVAVLVTDMSLYRPTIQAVFERSGNGLHYNLGDFSAVGASLFGQAVLGMLDLALNTFTRTDVLEVLLNPCFLTRLGADRAQALVWVRWAEQLGVFHGWDPDEKREQGYAPSPLFSWRLGVQRLRLGQYMEAPPEDDDREAPRFGQILPFADMDTHDRRHLDAFTRAVEGLLPALAKLRSYRGSGPGWAGVMRRLIDGFLDVPADRPEEGQVRDAVFGSLDQLALWGHLQDRSLFASAERLSLPLIREFFQAHLQGMDGARGGYLASGVTIAGLRPMRPIPFDVVYVLGLGENLFPGSNKLGAFDLRGQAALPGDVRPADGNRYLFLEALLAARKKVYLLYNSRDLQKDQDLLPAAPVLQLQRFLGEQVLDKPFTVQKAPLHYHDSATLLAADEPGAAHVHYSGTDRLLAFLQADAEGRLKLTTERQKKVLRDRLLAAAPTVALPSNKKCDDRVPAVSISELKRFLENPALAALRRHLGLLDDEEMEDAGDDEPFVSPNLVADGVAKRVLSFVVRQAVAGKLEDALANWPARLETLYHDAGLRSQVPEGAYAEVEHDRLREQVAGRLSQGLAEFLRERQKGQFCGPLLLGENFTPVGARTRFPALTLTLPRKLAGLSATNARLSGWTPFVWLLPDTLDILMVTGKKELKDKLPSHLFEPVLLYLALAANGTPGLDGPSSQEWLAGRCLAVHIACKNGLHTFDYNVSAAEASSYLADLTADFLDATAHDLLPLDVVSKSFDFAFTATDADAPSDFVEQLSDAIEESREQDRCYWDSSLLRLAAPEVQADAFAKIRKRYHLLDRGPALKRKQPKE